MASPKKESGGNWRLQGYRRDERGRYRLICTRIWNDAKFRSLSADAQRIFFLLLTHPNTTLVPGLFALEENAAAGTLHLDLEGYRIGYRELYAVGMVKGIAENSVVFLPNAFKYEPPTSPKVVRAWRKFVRHELPEIPLVDEALRHIYQGLMGIYEDPTAFDRCFREVFPELFKGVVDRVSERVPDRVSDTLRRSGSRIQDPGPRRGGGEAEPPKALNGAQQQTERAPKKAPPPPTEKNADQAEGERLAQEFYEARQRLWGLPPPSRTQPGAQDGCFGAVSALKRARRDPSEFGMAAIVFLDERNAYWHSKGFPLEGFLAQFDSFLPPVAHVAEDESEVEPARDFTPAELVWGSMREWIRRDGKRYALTWLDKLQAVEVSPAELRLRGPDHFFCDWVEDHYGQLIAEALVAMDSGPATVTMGSDDGAWVVLRPGEAATVSCA